ncbi:MAG: HlyD family efflux transporter periplasmic adaptor subunit [Rhizobiales bacterium]|nr:HlyD family efflux transporter periplasmic adaptor subunit [Hyphomicrobiales bacterium]
MKCIAALLPFRGWLNRPARTLLAAALCVLPQSVLAANETPASAAAVTVLTTAKSCFSDVVDAFGLLIPREEIAVRPDRPGLKVQEVLVDIGQTVTAGQALARIGQSETNAITVQAPAAGLISASTAVVGSIASGKGEALFNIITGNEFDLAVRVSTHDLAKLKVDQPATIRISGIDDLQGKVRQIGATIDPNSQLGTAFIAVTSKRSLLVNASGRASIKTGESCGVAVPLTAILYSSAGTVVQVVRRDRVETRRVETGLMSGGRVEIREGLSAGETVVARAGALLREGDPVRPIMADAAKK